jgi:fructose/tagatose bisphosphate aldolase
MRIRCKIGCVFPSEMVDLTEFVVTENKKKRFVDRAHNESVVIKIEISGTEDKIDILETCF